MPHVGTDNYWLIPRVGTQATRHFARSNEIAQPFLPVPCLFVPELFTPTDQYADPHSKAQARGDELKTVGHMEALKARIIEAIQERE